MAWLDLRAEAMPEMLGSGSDFSSPLGFESPVIHSALAALQY